MKRKLLSLTVALLMALSACITAAAFTTEDAAAKSRLSYTVTVQPSGSGSLYWNYGKNMEFFADGGKNYNAKCRISAGADYKFSSLAERGIIAVPKDGWYFGGFYDKSGRKISMEAVNIDVIRMTVKGIYFYDYIPSYDNPEFSRITEKAYKEMMKTTTKALYGTRVYKVLDQTVLYRLPKKDAAYYPKFVKMKAPDFPGSLTLEKKMDSPDFYIGEGLTVPKTTYSSSSSKIIKVDKVTGKARITGPGSATVTVKVPKTGKTLAAIYKVKVTVKPEAVTALSAKRTADKKYVSLNWKGNSLYSGYEVQISSSRSFGKITAKKTASSGKTSSTKVSISKSKSDLCKYARVRPYKTSGSKKLYGPYVTCAVK